MNFVNDNFHTIFGTGMAAPIHLSTAFLKNFGGARGINPYMGPLGLYTSYRAGRDMDRGELSQGDAIMNAGVLANNIARITEKPMRRRGPLYNFLRRRYGGSPGDIYTQPPENVSRNAHLAAVTLGLGLPLYMYYRQGIKKQEEPVEQEEPTDAYNN